MKLETCLKYFFFAIFAGTGLAFHVYFRSSVSNSFRNFITEVAPLDVLDWRRTWRESKKKLSAEAAAAKAQDDAEQLRASSDCVEVLD